MASLDELAIPAKSTASSIQSGIDLGIAEAVAGFIRNLKKEHFHLKTIATGGDASAFSDYLELEVASDDFTLQGINEFKRRCEDDTL